MFQRSGERRLKDLPFNRILPNILTMLALCAGLTAMRFALEERWEAAVGSLVVAAILDALDGRIARILQGTSKFGAELDSLSDFIGFGVAPGLILYLWVMREAGPVGWALVLLFGICCALRLARFNTNLEEPEPPAWERNFFVGMPSPGGGGVVLLPMIISFQTGEEYLRQPAVAGVFLAVVALLLISRFPTYSFKNMRVALRFVLFTLLGIGLFTALAISAPWLALTLFTSAYLATLPFSYRSYHARKKKYDAAGKMAEEDKEDKEDEDAPVE
jgi:CDP-diacylglycerol--serine O-phosphatidyltransferase